MNKIKPPFTKETAKAKVDQDWPAMRTLWAWGIRSILFISSAIAAIAACVILGSSAQSGIFPEDTFFVGLFLLPLLPLCALLGSVLRGLGHVVLGQLPILVLRPLSFLILIVISIYAFQEITPMLAISLNAGATAIALVFGLVFFLSRRPAGIRTADRSKKADPIWWKSAGIMALSAGMIQINNYSDLLILGALTTSVDVAVYRIAFQVSVLLGFGFSIGITIYANQY